MSLTVFIHPGWPWRFVDLSRPSDRRRMRRYRACVAEATASEHPVVLVGSPRCRRGPWGPDLAALASRSALTIPCGAAGQAFTRAARRLARWAIRNGHARIVLGGFYRNLCVREFVVELARFFPGEVEVSPRLTVGRNVY